MGPNKMRAKIRAKKKKRMMSLDIKQEIIEKHERGVRVVDLARQYDRSTSMICTILKQKETIKAITPAKGVTIISRLRTSVHEQMEKLLLAWLTEKQLEGDNVTESIICEKARDIYGDLVQQTAGTSTDEASEESFKASRGWFDNFKKRTGIYSVRHGVGIKVKPRFVDTHFINGAPTDEFPDPLDALDEKNAPSPPPNKKQKCEPNEVKIGSTEVISSSHTDHLNSEDEDNLAEVQGMALKQDESRSIEDSLRITAYCQAAEIKRLKKQLSALKYPSVTPEIINSSNIYNYFEFCTGFTFEIFNDLCKFFRIPTDSTAPQTVIPITYTKETWHTKHVPHRNQFLLVLMKLHNNYDTRDLAFKFQIDVQSVNLIFEAWINYLYLRLGQMAVWPHRKVISDHMPESFKKEFPTTFAIVDCAELKIERPTSLLFPSQTISDTKSTNTLKGLVVCDPRGSVLFVSALYTGSISDGDIFRQCNITSQLYHLLEIGFLKPGDGLMADKEFQNHSDVEEIGLCLNTPSFAKGKEQTLLLDVHMKKRMAKHRVTIKKVIRKIKKFKIVSDKIPNSTLDNINQIWFVVSMLTNFQPHILSQ